MPGLNAAEFARLFSCDSPNAIPELIPLIDEGFVEFRVGVYCLTELGLEFSDAIGPALYSARHLARWRFCPVVRYNILYRGPLSSCNYGCEYCPFAKHAESAWNWQRTGQP